MRKDTGIRGAARECYYMKLTTAGVWLIDVTGQELNDTSRRRKQICVTQRKICLPQTSDEKISIWYSSIWLNMCLRLSLNYSKKHILGNECNWARNDN